MKTYTVSFPAARFTVELPASAAGALLELYPGARGSSVVGAESPAARFSIAPDRENWRLDEDGAAGAAYPDPGAALLALEYRWVEILARSGPERIALHAGAVDVGGSACLLAGDSEAGKTSTTVQLVELGHPFLADEVAIVGVGTGESAVHPFHRTPAVGRGFSEDLVSIGGPRHGRLVEPMPSVRRYVPDRLGTEPVPVATLLLPRYRGGAAIEVADLEAGDALTEVLGYCFEPAGDPEPFLDALIGCLERWTIRRFIYGDAASARQALATLFAPGRSA